LVVVVGASDIEFVVAPVDQLYDPPVWLTVEFNVPVSPEQMVKEFILIIGGVMVVKFNVAKLSQPDVLVNIAV